MRLSIWTTVAGATLTSATVLLAGCTIDVPAPTATSTVPTDSPTTPSPSTATATVDPAVADAESAALEAYRGYWATKVAILAAPQAEPGNALETYAIDTGLTDVYSAVLSYRTNGIHMSGEPVLHPEASDVVPGDSGTATITDCVDVADWQPYYQDANEPAAAPGQSTNVLTVSEAEVYSGRWVIRSSTVDRDTPCSPGS